MVGLAVTFDLGRYHATNWGAHVNEATVEWPPSPWRLLRAVYSAGFTHVDLADARADLERALIELIRAQPPQFELPAANPSHTRHYVPLSAHSPTKQGATSLIVDAFNVLDPAAELRAWWHVDLDRAAREALERSIKAIGYLGRSESVCSIRVVDTPTSDDRDAVPVAELDDEDERWEGSERIDLLAVAEDAEDPLAVLGASVGDLRRRRMLAPPGTRLVTYAVRRAVADSLVSSVVAGARPTVAHLRVVGGNRPALTDAVPVGHLVRSALQRRFDRDRSGARSDVLSGHDGAGPRRDQHAHAHYLALPGRDGRRIDHIVVWASEGFGSDEVAAISGLRQLRMRDAPEPFQVALVALGVPEQLTMPRLLGPAVLWRSLTPLALTRHPKRRGGRTVDGAEDQVRRELAHRGFPAPIELELISGSWMRFVTTRPGVSRRGAPTVIGVRMRFSEPIAGPLALGGLSHFGLGLFEPEH